MSNSSVALGRLPIKLFSCSLIFLLSFTAGNAAPLTQAYVWYDGDHEQRIWLNPKMMAEIDPSPQGERVIKGVYARAVIVPTKTSHTAVRFWQLGDAAATGIINLKASHPKGKYSAVFHDAPTSIGGKRVLPGNIVVYLNPQWSEEVANDWIRSRKLVVIRKLEIGQNVYIIQTGSGLESLEIANELYKSGEVKAAFPDWWQEVVAR